MKFLPSRNSDKTILVISDLHLSAGVLFENRRNPLEDFTFDNELINFIKYFSEKKYLSKPVELIINGDFLDFLAVPFVEYFDDEYWSEKSSVAKLQIILDAHKKVFEALSKFLETKNKSIIYQLGNHDSELLFPKVQEVFLKALSEKARSNITIICNLNNTYIPIDGVYIQHGHQYEVAHQYDPEKSIATAINGELYHIPSWGSYYVVKLINKFKQERHYVDKVRPIRKFIIHGLIYDTIFVLRFMFANIYYFIMIRIIMFFKNAESLTDAFNLIKNELILFQDYEDLTKDILEENDDMDVLIVGHTHVPTIINYDSGKIFVNTGTWGQMYNLDFDKSKDINLTFAQIEVSKLLKNKPKDQSKNKSYHLSKEIIKNDIRYEVFLNYWKGDLLPFDKLG